MRVKVIDCIIVKAKSILVVLGYISHIVILSFTVILVVILLFLYNLVSYWKLDKSKKTVSEKLNK